MEVVPYNPVSILPVFEERQREFHFAGRKWVVAQQWSELGVAAVVWEAVSSRTTCHKPHPLMHNGCGL